LKKGHGWMLIPEGSESKQIVTQFKRKDDKSEIQRTTFNIGGDPRASAQSSSMVLQRQPSKLRSRWGDFFTEWEQRR